MKRRWNNNLTVLKKMGKAENTTLSQQDVFEDRLQRMLEKVNGMKENRKQWEQ
jgi:hypothetical protein